LANKTKTTAPEVAAEVRYNWPAAEWIDCAQAADQVGSASCGGSDVPFILAARTSKEHQSRSHTRIDKLLVSVWF